MHSLHSHFFQDQDCKRLKCLISTFLSFSSFNLFLNFYNLIFLYFYHFSELQGLKFKQKKSFDFFLPQRRNPFQSCSITNSSTRRQFNRTCPLFLLVEQALSLSLKLLPNIERFYFETLVILRTFVFIFLHFCYSS